MPIYEYQCQKCGEHLEKRQSVSDEPLKVCEKCGGELEKKISLSGFQFKGAGWYVTDYAGKNGKATEKADKGSEKTSGGESTSGADGASKPSSETTTAKPDSASSKE